MECENGANCGDCTKRYMILDSGLTGKYNKDIKRGFYPIGNATVDLDDGLGATKVNGVNTCHSEDAIEKFGMKKEIVKSGTKYISGDMEDVVGTAKKDLPVGILTDNFGQENGCNSYIEIVED